MLRSSKLPARCTPGGQGPWASEATGHAAPCAGATVYGRHVEPTDPSRPCFPKPNAAPASKQMLTRTRFHPAGAQRLPPTPHPAGCDSEGRRGGGAAATAPARPRPLTVSSIGKGEKRREQVVVVVVIGEGGGEGALGHRGAR